MKKWYCFFIVIVFTACQKGIDWSYEPGSGSTQNNITGTWKFVSLSGNQQSITEYTQSDTDYKTIAIASFTTTDSSGEFSFNNDSTFSATNIDYNLSYTTYIHRYKNGILSDSEAIPASYPLDSSTFEGTYELINNDSIYFPRGYILSSGLNIASNTASGGKYNKSGNILTITQSATTDSTENIGGLPFHITDSQTFVTTLQKE